MFGINKKQLINNLELYRKSICCYGPHAKRCDCKFDPKPNIKTLGLTEHTCCPELRQVIEMLEVMDSNTFKKLCSNAKIIVSED